MLAEFTIGELPWSKLKKNRKETYDMKISYDHRLLLKNLPLEFNKFLEHLQDLKFEEKPDYPMLLGMY